MAKFETGDRVKIIVNGDFIFNDVELVKRGTLGTVIKVDYNNRTKNNVLLRPIQVQFDNVIKPKDWLGFFLYPNMLKLVDDPVGNYFKWLKGEVEKELLTANIKQE